LNKTVICKEVILKRLAIILNGLGILASLFFILTLKQTLAVVLLAIYGGSLTLLLSQQKKVFAGIMLGANIVFALIGLAILISILAGAYDVKGSNLIIAFSFMVMLYILPMSLNAMFIKFRFFPAKRSQLTDNK